MPTTTFEAPYDQLIITSPEPFPHEARESAGIMPLGRRYEELGDTIGYAAVAFCRNQNTSYADHPLTDLCEKLRLFGDCYEDFVQYDETRGHEHIEKGRGTLTQRADFGAMRAQPSDAADQKVEVRAQFTWGENDSELRTTLDITTDGVTKRTDLYCAAQTAEGGSRLMLTGRVALFEAQTMIGRGENATSLIAIGNSLEHFWIPNQELVSAVSAQA